MIFQVYFLLDGQLSDPINQYPSSDGSLPIFMVYNQILIAKIQSCWLMKGFMMNISYYSKESKFFKSWVYSIMSREKIKNVIGKDHKTLLIDSKNWIKKLA